MKAVSSIEDLELLLEPDTATLLGLLLTPIETSNALPC